MKFISATYRGLKYGMDARAVKNGRAPERVAWRILTKLTNPLLRRVARKIGGRG